jgi:hypothetical protein
MRAADERGGRDVKLPNLDHAIAPPEKITHYLLSLTHPKGRSKAVFFLRFGFTADAWKELDRALREHAAVHEVSEVADTEFGKQYVVEGVIRAPDGRQPPVRVVWHIDHGAVQPRLATAYPAGR